MAEKDRLYTIPLRREWLKSPRGKRANKATATIQKFLKKHLHASDVKISQMVNETIWIRGIEKPPAKIRVKTSIDADGVVTARLPEEAALKEAMEKTEEKPKKEEKDEKTDSKTDIKTEDKPVEKPVTDKSDDKKNEETKEPVADTKTDKQAEDKKINQKSSEKKEVKETSSETPEQKEVK